MKKQADFPLQNPPVGRNKRVHSESLGACALCIRRTNHTANCLSFTLYIITNHIHICNCIIYDDQEQNTSNSRLVSPEVKTLVPAFHLRTRSVDTEIAWPDRSVHLSFRKKVKTKKRSASNKCHATRNRCLTSSNKCLASSNKCLSTKKRSEVTLGDFLGLKLLVTSASLLVTSALLVVTRTLLGAPGIATRSKDATSSCSS